jgi:hypothetical protein
MIFIVFYQDTLIGAFSSEQKAKEYAAAMHPQGVYCKSLLIDHEYENWTEPGEYIELY